LPSTARKSNVTYVTGRDISAGSSGSAGVVKIRFRITVPDVYVDTRARRRHFHSDLIQRGTLLGAGPITRITLPSMRARQDSACARPVQCTGQESVHFSPLDQMLKYGSCTTSGRGRRAHEMP
jgi:hypothetical protein